MYKYAHILHGQVHEIIEHEAGPVTIQKEYFSPELLLIDITNDPRSIEVGWPYVNGEIQEPETDAGPTPEEQRAAMKKQLTDAVQAYMDKAAQARGYDNIISAVTYADEPAVPKFQAEGIAYRSWRSSVWAYCYAQLDAVLAGQREVPTPEQLIEEIAQEVPLVLPE